MRFLIKFSETLHQERYDVQMSVNITGLKKNIGLIVRTEC